MNHSTLDKGIFFFCCIFQLKCITWLLLFVFSTHLEPDEMLWISIPVDSLREPAPVPSRSPAFWRLIGISRLPDSSCIKSHLANLTIWDWMKNKWDRQKQGERDSVCRLEGVAGNEKDKESTQRGREVDKSWDLGKTSMTVPEDFELCSRHLRLLYVDRSPIPLCLKKLSVKS